MLITTRHPKIVEDERAVEVVLRLQEDTTVVTGENSTGRRLTVTAVGSHLSTEFHNPSISSTSIAGGPDISRPVPAQVRRSSSNSRSGRASTAATATIDFARPPNTLQPTGNLARINEQVPSIAGSSATSLESRSR